MKSNKQAGICPVCARPNHCARASAESETIKECWCFSMSEPLDKSIQADLAQNNKQCVCRNCWEKAAEKDS